MSLEGAPLRAAHTHALNRAVEHLIGLITGMVADGHLHDREIMFLRTWLSEHALVTRTWPGSLVRRKVEDVLLDGVITEAERSYLLEVFSMLAASEFSLTGSASPEVASLPINDSVTVDIKDSSVCHTGEFLFGTRAAVERATLGAGGTPVDQPSRRVQLLVIGTRVSPHWAHTSFGRKIQRAVELQEGGHPIEIISERRWFDALSR